MIQSIKRNLRDQRGYVAFLLVWALFFGYYLYLTFDYTQYETWLFPRIITLLGLLFLFLNFSVIAFSDQIPDLIKESQAGGSDVEDLTEDDQAESSAANEPVSNTEEESVEPKSYLFSIIKEIGWLLGYLIGVYYIGFFTTTFLYTVLYIVAHSEDRTFRTGLTASGIALGINAFLWFLFIYMMNSSSVFRLGMFP